VWVTLIGFASGGSISLSLALLGMRAKNARQAGELSGMAQSIGYVFAAVGPILIGLRSEEHTSELQSRFELVCRLLHEKKKVNLYSEVTIAEVLDKLTDASRNLFTGDNFGKQVVQACNSVD